MASCVCDRLSNRLDCFGDVFPRRPRFHSPSCCIPQLLQAIAISKKVP